MPASEVDSHAGRSHRGEAAAEGRAGTRGNTVDEAFIGGHPDPDKTRTGRPCLCCASATAVEESRRRLSAQRRAGSIRQYRHGNVNEPRQRIRATPFHPIGLNRDGEESRFCRRPERIRAGGNPPRGPPTSGVAITSSCSTSGSEAWAFNHWTYKLVLHGRRRPARPRISTGGCRDGRTSKLASWRRRIFPFPADGTASGKTSDPRRPSGPHRPTG